MSAIVFTGETEVNRFVVVTLRSAIKLYSKTGMKPNRAYTPTNMKKMAEKLTGKTFKRGDWDSMVVALTEILED